jgi:hypothetical protein
VKVARADRRLSFGTPEIRQQKKKKKVLHHEQAILPTCPMMDTESGVDGEDYYRRRLTVTAYGQWLVWLHSEKSQAVEDEERAVRCRLFGSRLTAMSRLAALVSASRRTSYHLRLANVIHALVLLNKGMQRLRYYRALAESLDSWALQRWAQQRSLFRALCRLHDALRRKKSSRLLSPGRLQLAKVAVERWAEFTSNSLRSRGQQRRADVCWRRLALKRAVGTPPYPLPSSSKCDVTIITYF